MGVTIAASVFTFNRPEYFARWMLNPYMVVHRKQYYRVITSGLIHKDYMHLILNMMSMYFFGPIIENLFYVFFGHTTGVVYFIALYLITMVVADIPSIIRHRDHYAYNSLGASGAVSGVVFAFIAFLPTQDVCLYFVICLPGFILGALYIIFSYYQDKRGADHINHSAHLFGALAGLIFCVIIHPQVVPQFFEQLTHWRWSLFH